MYSGGAECKDGMLSARVGPASRAINLSFGVYHRRPPGKRAQYFESGLVWCSTDIKTLLEQGKETTRRLDHWVAVDLSLTLIVPQ